MPVQSPVPCHVPGKGKHDVSLLYHLTWRGFCTEMIWLSNAYLFSVINGYNFVLHSRNWIGFVEQGWQDYFIPFFEENNDPSIGIVSPSHAQLILLIIVFIFK